MKTLILEVVSTGPNGEGPRWAKLDLEIHIWAHIEKLSQLCLQHMLASVTVNRGPNDWGGHDTVLVMEQMVVQSDRLWFRAEPKHADYVVETLAVTRKDLHLALQGEPFGAALIEGDMVYQNINAKEAWLEYLASQSEND